MSYFATVVTRHQTSAYSEPDLPNSPAYIFKPGQPSPGQPNLLRPPIAIITSTGILTRFPSTTHFCLALGVDSPCPD